MIISFIIVFNGLLIMVLTCLTRIGNIRSGPDDLLTLMFFKIVSMSSVVAKGMFIGGRFLQHSFILRIEG